MLKVLLLLCSVVFGVNAADYLATKPDWMTSCSALKADRETCFAGNLQSVLGKLVDGLPGFTGYKTLDPLDLKRVTIAGTNSGIAQININLKDVKVTGYRTVKVEPIRILSDTILATQFVFPKMSLMGEYKVNGHILSIPLQGNGRFLQDVDNSVLDMKIKAYPYTRDGLVFYNVTRIRLDFNYEFFKVQLDNLFNGNKELGDATNDLLNQNWREVGEAMKPILRETVEQIVLLILRPIFDYFPLNYFIDDVPKPKE